jgi:hypothetical protein
MATSMPHFPKSRLTDWVSVDAAVVVVDQFAVGFDCAVGAMLSRHFMLKNSQHERLS